MANKNGLSQIHALAEKWHPTQIKWRRHLHQYPELSNKEIKTTKFLKDNLTQLGLKTTKVRTLSTGLIASLKSNTKGGTVALRSDIDALPITEMTNLPFKSRIEGCMHACGHDVHMATVLGAAAILSELKDQFAGEVRFLFQPAEEKPPGGARPMIKAGAISGVDLILGLHVDPHLKTGSISLRDGATMASVYDFDLIIIGQGGHAARPHTTVDAIVTAAEVVESLQSVISREIDPISPAVITFGKIEGGMARNIIAEKVLLRGTARALSIKTTKHLPELIKKTVAGVCRARGAKFEIKEIAGYPVLKNHKSANRLLESNFKALYPRRKIAQTELVLGGEDFACYLEHVPGAMFRLGTMNKKIGADKPWHAADFSVDESAMRTGSALLAASVINFLRRK